MSIPAAESDIHVRRAAMQDDDGINDQMAPVTLKLDDSVGN